VSWDLAPKQHRPLRLNRPQRTDFWRFHQSPPRHDLRGGTTTYTARKFGRKPNGGQSQAAGSIRKDRFDLPPGLPRDPPQAPRLQNHWRLTSPHGKGSHHPRATIYPRRVYQLLAEG